MGEQRQTIGVMAVPELKKAVERQAKTEGRSASNLAERLLAWAMENLRAAGNSETLVSWEVRPPRRGTKRVSQETQEEVYQALEMIFDRAPSTVIERVVEYITERAGKYGGER